MASPIQGPNRLPDYAAWTKAVVDSVKPSHGTFTLTESYIENGEPASRTIQIQLGDGEARAENCSDTVSPSRLKQLECVQRKEGGDIACADLAELCENLGMLMREWPSVRDKSVLLETRMFVNLECRNFQANFQVKVVLSDNTEYILYNGDRSNQVVVQKDSHGNIVPYYTRRNFTTALFDGVRGTGYAVTNTLGRVFGSVTKALGFTE